MSQRTPDPPIERPPSVGPDFILRVLRVAPEQAGMRVDVFLAQQLRSTSRTRARTIVENSAFTPLGRRLRPSERLRAEDRVVLWRPPFEEDEGPSDELSILYEDEHLLVVDKPPLMAVHPTARYHRHTVIRRLAEQRPGEHLSLVHRLDRDTSGILLVARSTAADRAFKRLLEDRSLAIATAGSTTELSRGMAAAARRGAALADLVHKTYLAITWGAPREGLIDVPLELDPDNPLRVKMRTARPGAGLESRTEVTVLERRPGYCLVACRLLTGRQHQIRVHLASQGAPIVGDKLYGPDERLHARGADGELTDADWHRLELPRQALHAHRYQLPHAITGQTLDLVSPLSPDLQRFWDSRPTAPAP